MLGPLLTSLPKSESAGGDDGPVATTTATTNAGGAAGVNMGRLTVTPVLTVGPNGSQQHILQVKKKKNILVKIR